MNITIRGKNIEVTDSLRNYVEKKLTRLNRYFDHIREAQVTFYQERGRYVVEVTIPLDSIILRGEEESGENFYTAIDLVSEKLEKQIHRYRTKLYKRFRNKGLKDLIIEMEKEGKKEEEEPRVVRTKRFAMKPMSVEEAILQMNLLGHDFFVFTNAETEQVNVVYRRRDGNYGLIEPDV
ncbi:MAG: Ribosomal subunit interface protein YfiA [Thermoanaerobacterales bacterium 50_218]|nr:MAG: Ribosomal subunit interface protein YfiA [Thermoanaerobacterales bacterium 50_218]HAA90154.1 ribosome-associated translation inhibitor RaiA [Peptococcaceae bacterium]